MAQLVAMPKFGQATEESTIVKWHKKEGDAVKKGDVLFEIETDKAVLEVESFHEGTLLKILVKEGETVPVTAPVAFIGAPGEAVPAVPPAAAARPPEKLPAAPATGQPQTEAPRAAAATAETAPAAEAPQPAARPASPAPAASSRASVSPRARALARKCAISVARIRGTGPGGRIVEKDVQAHLESVGYDRLKISPAARNMAVREGIDITTVRGTGTGGRIMTHDIERAIAERPRPMSKMRQVIANRLTQSFTTTPHFFVTVSTDLTALLALREDLKRQRINYSVTDFILEAVVLSLQEFPVVNSTTDGKTVRWNSGVHLGLAVSLDDGLVVPVLRHAQDMNLPELHEAALDLTGRAREGRLLPDDMTGSTFTVSNMGMLNVDDFTAIINPGEAAILAVASARPTPVVTKKGIEVRSVMKITLSSDHRIIDGAIAARFINAIRSKLEDMELWKSLI